jgi:hypothetical protein
MQVLTDRGTVRALAPLPHTMYASSPVPAGKPRDRDGMNRDSAKIVHNVPWGSLFLISFFYLSPPPPLQRRREDMWNRFFYGSSVKDEDDNYGVSILTSMT